MDRMRQPEDGLRSKLSRECWQMRRRQSKRLGSSTGCAGSSLPSERPFNGRGSEQRWQRFVAADKHRSQPHSFADAIAKLGKWLVPRRGLEPPRLASLVPETSASTNSATWARASLTDRATPLSIPAWPCWHAWEAHVQSLLTPNCNTNPRLSGLRTFAPRTRFAFVE